MIAVLPRLPDYLLRRFRDRCGTTLLMLGAALRLSPFLPDSIHVGLPENDNARPWSPWEPAA